MKKDPIFKIIGLLIVEELKAILYFPIWWYSKGFLKVLNGAWNWLKDFELTMGFWLWVKNLFVPMFGQHDFAGRVISFFLRLVQIIYKGIALLIILIILLAFVIFWLILPLLVIYKILTYL